MEQTSDQLSAEELRAWLIIQQTNSIGRTRLEKLLTVFSSVNELVAASADQLRGIAMIGEKTISALTHPNEILIEHCLEWLTQAQHHFIPLSAADYPPQLAAAADAPPTIFVKGNKEILSQPQLALVGSRNPDRYGEEKAQDFAAALAACGITVTSGLALGIDGAAHRGALAAGGDTVAVLGTGLDHIYPRQHHDLAQQICQQGCLVSEQALDCPAKAYVFPRRNRIISGLSLGCLVLQASLRSGSLITARFALEQNREVFALPGSVDNPLSKGCHRLIRHGAKLIETTEQILIELKEILNIYIVNSNKFTLPQNNEIMDMTSYDAGAAKQATQEARDSRKRQKTGRETGQKTRKKPVTPKSPVQHDSFDLDAIEGTFNGTIVGTEDFVNRQAPINGLELSPCSTPASGNDHELCKQKILQCLQYESATIDALVESCDLSISKVSSMLQELELLGDICLHGGRYRRVQR